MKANITLEKEKERPITGRWRKIALARDDCFKEEPEERIQNHEDR